jgi:hypothetical protein
MTDRIKSFAVVGEESEEFIAGAPFGVEFVSKREDVISEVSSREKHLLMMTNELLCGVDNAGHESERDDPVVGIVNTDGSGVLDQMRGLFRNEHKAGAVEVSGRGLRGGEGCGNVKQEGAGNVRELFVDREGDAVGATGGVWGRMDGVENDWEAEGFDEGRVDRTRIVGDVIVNEGGVVVRVVVPNGGKVVLNEGAKDGGVLGRGGGGFGFEG